MNTFRTDKLMTKSKHCQVFLGNIEAVNQDKLLAILSNKEIAKANSYCNQSDRQKFVVNRGILKKLLAAYVNQPENEILIDYSTKGKPFISEMQSLQFNISHSEDVLVIGFVQNMDIGIDIENINRDLNIEKLETFLFTPTELELFRSTNKTLKPEAFINCWTRKEAILKATGYGLTQPMNELEVSFLKMGAFEIRSENTYLGNKSSWFLDSFKLLDNYRGAVAVRGGVDSIEFIDLKNLEWLFN
jgi:4'-phosphopantetheinyl transferase